MLQCGCLPGFFEQFSCFKHDVFSQRIKRFDVDSKCSSGGQRKYFCHYHVYSKIR